MTKSRHVGNRAARKYRNRIRRGRSMIIKAPWGKELMIPRGYSPQYPPPGYDGWWNNWGRGITSREHIPTPYDYGLSEQDKKLMFPDWYKRYYAAIGIAPPL